MQLAGFEILGELGRGGMGVLLRARTAEGREAALEVIRPDHADGDQFVALGKGPEHLRKMHVDRDWTRVLELAED